MSVRIVSRVLVEHEVGEAMTFEYAEVVVPGLAHMLVKLRPR